MMPLENAYLGAYDMINQQTQLNNAWSAQMAANNMNFQMNMANTAHQREVADLKAAGLNPVLSAHGNGAPVGSGAMASPDTNNTAALTSLLKDLIASNTEIGIANAKAAGGGFNYGAGRQQTTAGEDPDDNDGNSGSWNPVGGYSLDLKGFQNFLTDIYYGITGKTPRETVVGLGNTAKDHGSRYLQYKQMEKNYYSNPTAYKPVVTTAAGNKEYGAIPRGTLLEYLWNPISTAAKYFPG